MYSIETSLRNVVLQATASSSLLFLRALIVKLLLFALRENSNAGPELASPRGFWLPRSLTTSSDFPVGLTNVDLQ